MLAFVLTLIHPEECIPQGDTSRSLRRLTRHPHADEAFALGRHQSLHGPAFHLG
jgi:hypothetical protein